MKVIKYRARVVQRVYTFCAADADAEYKRYKTHMRACDNGIQNKINKLFFVLDPPVCTYTHVNFRILCVQVCPVLCRYHLYHPAGTHVIVIFNFNHAD